MHEAYTNVKYSALPTNVRETYSIDDIWCDVTNRSTCPHIKWRRSGRKLLLIVVHPQVPRARFTCVDPRVGCVLYKMYVRKLEQASNTSAGTGDVPSEFVRSFAQRIAREDTRTFARCQKIATLREARYRYEMSMQYIVDAVSCISEDDRLSVSVTTPPALTRIWELFGVPR